MNTTRHLVKIVTAAIVGALTMLVLGVSAAWAGPAPLDQPGAPSPAPPSSSGEEFWTSTSIGLAAIAALAVVTVVAVMVTTIRHHHHGAPAAV